MPGLFVIFIPPASGAIYCTLPQVVLRRRGSPSMSSADQPKSQILGHRPASRKRNWLVVFLPFEKYARQIGSFSQVGVKIKNI